MDTKSILLMNNGTSPSSRQTVGCGSCTPARSSRSIWKSGWSQKSKMVRLLWRYKGDIGHAL